MGEECLVTKTKSSALQAYLLKVESSLLDSSTFRTSDINKTANLRSYFGEFSTNIQTLDLTRNPLRSPKPPRRELEQCGSFTSACSHLCYRVAVWIAWDSPHFGWFQALKTLLSLWSSTVMVTNVVWIDWFLPFVRLLLLLLLRGGSGILVGWWFEWLRELVAF